MRVFEVAGIVEVRQFKRIEICPRGQYGFQHFTALRHAHKPMPDVSPDVGGVLHAPFLPAFRLDAVVAAGADEIVDAVFVVGETQSDHSVSPAFDVGDDDLCELITKWLLKKESQKRKRQKLPSFLAPKLRDILELGNNRQKQKIQFG